MRRLRDAGVTSYKLFMAYPGVLYVDDGTLYRAFRQAGDNDTRICMHAENGIVIDEIIREAVADGKIEPKYHGLTRPTRMEAEGVYRSIAIAEVANVPLYIVHLSSHDALEEVKRGRARGVDVVAETCPQYLLLDHSWYEREGFEGAKWVMTPALREKWNQDSLWQGLQFRDLETIGTDHCPFCFKDQKELGLESFTKIPNGAPGVENRMSVIYDAGVATGRISLNRYVELTSTAAAKAFGLFPKKGTIAVGSDADIVIFDPEQDGHDQRRQSEHAPHERRLLGVRRPRDQGLDRDRAEPRSRDRAQPGASRSPRAADSSSSAPGPGSSFAMRPRGSAE